MTGIQLNANYDLFVRNGKLTLGEITPQNQALLLAAHKGEYKESPLLGVGLSDVTNDHDWNGWKRIIAEQLETDGQRIDRLEISEKGLILEAQYK